MSHTTPSPADHLALLLVTESNRPNEWPFIADCVLQRVASKQFPGNLTGVIYAPWQFSFFNEWTTRGEAKDPDDIFREARKKVRVSSEAFEMAKRCAYSMLTLPRPCQLLPPKTFNYWSPRSMKPAGSLPRGWNWNILHCFEIPGIPAERFVWAETREAGAPGTGNAHLYDFRGVMA